MWFELPLDVFLSRNMCMFFLCAQGNVLLPRNASVSELFLTLRLYDSLGTTDWVNRYISRKQHWYFNQHYINSGMQQSEKLGYKC